MGGTVIVSTVMAPSFVGITLEGVKTQVVPVGRLARSHDNVTLLAVPFVKVAMIVVEPEFRGVSATPPVLERV